MTVPENPGGRGRGETASGDRPASLSSSVASRVEEIVRAAEQEAASMQRDLAARRQAAELEAERHVQEAERRAEAVVAERVARMRRLTDELIERAEATARHFDALIAALEAATVALDSQPSVALGRHPADPSPSQAAAPQRQSRPVPGPEVPLALRAALRDPRAAAPAPGPSPTERGAFDGRAGLSATAPDDIVAAAHLEAARLVAVEMAVAGRTRTEVDAHLRDAFRLNDIRDLLDDVFGAGTGEPRAPTS